MIFKERQYKKFTVMDPKLKFTLWPIVILQNWLTPTDDKGTESGNTEKADKQTTMKSETTSANKVEDVASAFDALFAKK